MKKHTVVPFRLDPRTAKQIKELRDMGYGNRNTILRDAIHMLYWTERKHIDNSPITRDDDVRISQATDDAYVWLVETDFDSPQTLFEYLGLAFHTSKNHAHLRGYGQGDGGRTIHASRSLLAEATELYKRVKREPEIRISQPTDESPAWLNERDGFVWLVETEFPSPAELYRYLRDMPRYPFLETGWFYSWHYEDHFKSIFASPTLVAKATEMYKADMVTNTTPQDTHISA